MPGSFYLTAGQAAAALDVTMATLYAYASRGQLRSQPMPGRSRERRYVREDIERLKERKEARRDPSRVAARGLHWGGPVLESGITLIRDGALYYRGRDVLELAKSSSLEQVAGLLWGAGEDDGKSIFDQRVPLTRQKLNEILACTSDPIARLQVSLPVAAASDAASYDLRPHAVRQTGARMLRLLTTIVGRRDSGGPAHRALQAAWSPKSEACANVIRTVLVLCADHELNVSAFTARCAASAGASPYDVVSAALATLKGFRHGGAAERVIALLHEAKTSRQARVAVAGRLRRGEGLPGFGHPLYPGGDPRAVRLLQLAEAAGNEKAWRPFRNLQKAGMELMRDRPNLDFGLAAVTRCYRLPEQAPVVLFAVGRTIGWIAHALEEYASGELIRPRARYTGPLPAAER